MPEDTIPAPEATYEDALAQAMKIACAQAGVKTMSPEDVVAYVRSVAKGILAAENGVQGADEQEPAVDPKTSIRENSIICLECGKKFRVMSIRHLKTHGLDANSYREKWGLKKNTSLACKSLVRMRRKRMADMKIWTHRKKSTTAAPETPEE